MSNKYNIDFDASIKDGKGKWIKRNGCQWFFSENKFHQGNDILPVYLIVSYFNSNSFKLTGRKEKKVKFIDKNDIFNRMIIKFFKGEWVSSSDLISIYGDNFILTNSYFSNMFSSILKGLYNGKNYKIVYYNFMINSKNKDSYEKFRRCSLEFNIAKIHATIRKTKQDDTK